MHAFERHGRLWSHAALRCALNGFYLIILYLAGENDVCSLLIRFLVIVGNANYPVNIQVGAGGITASGVMNLIKYC